MTAAKEFGKFEAVSGPGRVDIFGAGAMKITIRDAAKAVGVSESLLYQWCQERRLRHYRLGGEGKRGRIMVDEADLAAFLESCSVEPGAVDEGNLKYIH